MKQIGGTHYDLPIQPIEYIEANNLSFSVGSIIKYVTRYKQKNGVEDLQKAQWYIDRLIKQEEQCHQNESLPNNSNAGLIH